MPAFLGIIFREIGNLPELLEGGLWKVGFYILKHRNNLTKINNLIKDSPIYAIDCP